MQPRKLIVFGSVFAAGMITGGLTIGYINDKVTQTMVGTAYGEAIEAYNSGEPYKAIGMFFISTVHDPNRYLPYAYLGDIFSELGSNQVALDMYNKALSNTYKKQDLGMLEELDTKEINNDRTKIQKKIYSIKGDPIQSSVK